MAISPTDPPAPYLPCPFNAKDIDQMNLRGLRRRAPLLGDTPPTIMCVKKEDATPRIKRGDPLQLVLGDWIKVIVPVVAAHDEKKETVPIRHGDTRAIVNVRSIKPAEWTACKEKGTVILAGYAETWWIKQGRELPACSKEKSICEALRSVSTCNPVNV